MLADSSVKRHGRRPAKRDIHTTSAPRWCSRARCLARVWFCSSEMTITALDIQFVHSEIQHPCNDRTVVLVRVRLIIWVLSDRITLRRQVDECRAYRETVVLVSLRKTSS
ncbi:hypothetical protein GQ44DRAFT_238606 [Phaeosphaeriaceae sp. PMI808]|nr:hypothetical protein GQ44DRAFT_238606 [Phaeosphaeriaceae sp. PMI808]